MHGGKAMLARPQQQGGSTNQHTRKVAGKSKQTQRVYSSVQGILRTLVQRGIFEETGMPVDTVGLRKISKSQSASQGANSSLHRVMAPPPDKAAGQHSFSAGA